MKKILIIASTYMDLEISGNNRTNFIPQFLLKNGYDVKLIMSDFSHHRKKHIKNDFEKREYEVITIHEPGYSKNVELRRIYSINVFSRNLNLFLKSYKETFDYVYVFTPPHKIVKIAKKFSTKTGAKLVVDVRDLWPEAYKMIVKNNLLYNLIFFPFKIYANHIYKLADIIISVSDTYRNRALKVNKDCISKTIYIGTSLSEFDSYRNNSNILKPKNEFWMIYVGTLGKSYDIKLVMDSMIIIKNMGYKEIKFIILGNGPHEKKLKSYAKKNDVNVKFMGRKEYKEMVSILVLGDLVVNPLVKNAPQSIINKHADYAASGIPVINTQNNKEYINLLKKFNAGLNVYNFDKKELAKKIIFFYKNNKKREEIGKNHRILAETLFDRDKIYNNLLEILL